MASRFLTWCLIIGCMMTVMLTQSFAATQDYSIENFGTSFSRIDGVLYITITFDIANSGDTPPSVVDYAITLNGVKERDKTDTPVSAQNPARVSYFTGAIDGTNVIRVTIDPPEDGDGENTANNEFNATVVYEPPQNAESVLPQTAGTILGAITLWQQDTQKIQGMAIVTGKDAAALDGPVANSVHDIFFPAQRQSKSKSHRFLDSDIKGTRTFIVLIGGGCANELVPFYFPNQGYDCEGWKLKPGQAVIKYAKTEIGEAILVAGTNKEDTAKAIKEFNNYFYNFNFKYKDEILLE